MRHLGRRPSLVAHFDNGKQHIDNPASIQNNGLKQGVLDPLKNLWLWLMLAMAMDREGIAPGLLVQPL